MQKKISYILVILFIYSCTSNTIYKKPDDLIEEELMIELLVDIHLATAAKSAKNLNGKYGLNYMPLVYEKYKIDSGRFARSSFYYSTDIDVETRLLRKVKEQIKLLTDENSEALQLKDSLDDIEKRKERGDLIKAELKDSIVI